MEDNYLVLRKDKFNKFNKITTDSFKESLIQFSLKLRKQKIHNLIMTKRKLIKKFQNENFQFISTNYINYSEDFKTQIFYFQTIEKEKEQLKRIILFQEYITHILKGKIDFEFFNNNSKFIIQTLTQDFPLILFDLTNKYQNEIKIKILYLYILFIQQGEISNKIIHIYTNKLFLDNLNNLINYLLNQKEFSLSLITLCNFLIICLLQFNKKLSKYIFDSINVEFLIDSSINQIFSFSENEFTSNFNPLETIFIVLILLIENYILNLNINETEKYCNICRKISKLFKFIINKHPNQIYMIYETINLFKLCKVKDYINDKEINSIFHQILKYSYENFHICNLGILLVTLKTIYKEFNFFINKNNESDLIINENVNNNINFSLINGKILSYIYKIIFNFFNEFSENKSELKKNLNIFVYSIKIISQFFNLSFDNNNIKEQLNYIIIPNENLNLSIIQIIKICYSISIEESDFSFLTITILNFFKTIFSNNQNENNLLKQYLISNDLKIHVFLGRKLNKTIKYFDITFNILQILKNILNFSNKISQTNNIKFDLQKIGFDELMNNFQINSNYEEIRGLSYELLREYFDNEFINDNC
jgi:hypothetical protein